MTNWHTIKENELWNGAGGMWIYHNHNRGEFELRCTNGLGNANCLNLGAYRTLESAKRGAQHFLDNRHLYQ